MLWLSIASAVVAVVCALIVIAAVRRCAALFLSAQQLVQSLSAERGRIAAHDAELDQITDTLRKLSGRIGAARKESKQTNSPSDAVDDVNRLTWKAQMREKYGLSHTRN